MKKLTPDQQKLAASGIHLATALACKFVKKLTDKSNEQEYHSAAQLALCHAALSYDPSLGSLWTTYAYKVIQNALMRTHRNLKPKGFRHNKDSNQPPVILRRSQEHLDEIPDPRTAHPQIDETLEGLRDSTKQILTDHILGGRSCRQIARDCQANPSAIRNKITRALTKLRRQLAA
jgi:RNA polymerase sigma factor (sigma-70 family)